MRPRSSICRSNSPPITQLEQANGKSGFNEFPIQDISCKVQYCGVANAQRVECEVYVVILSDGVVLIRQ